MKKISIVFLAALCFSNCNDDTFIQMQLDLTVCNEPWEFEFDADEVEKAETIEAYLNENYDIEVESIIVERLGTGNMAYCFGCVCTTGDVATLEVNQGFETKLEEIGFDKSE